MPDKKFKAGKGLSGAYDDPKLRQYLMERMKRNQELGLESSPEDTDILYNSFMNDNVQGYVEHDNPKRIVINPSLSEQDLPLKATIAHELDHVNSLNAEKNPETSRYTSKDKPSSNDPEFWNKKGQYDYSSAFHENPKYIDKYIPPFANQTRDEERRRILYSITHPFAKDRPAPYSSYIEGDIPRFREGKPVFSESTLVKYAKEAGVPIDDIIDAMVMNSAVRTDKLASEAHDKTKENLKQGRGIYGELFTKKKSTEEAYKPWKDMQEKRKKKK